MDAIPSLCATTASCGAAAIGYVYGRPGPQSQEPQARVNGAEPHDTTINSRPPLEAAAPSRTPLRPQHHRRPQSASIPTTPLWGTDGEASLVKGAEDTLGGQQGGYSLAWAPARESSEGKPSPRTPWARRMSTITQSHDGSSLSSARPSSPSLFSNGSNAPFFPSNQAVTPRNRLVKRSTSHRVLHSASYHSSPLSLPQTSTLRRPATSHQRAEQLRLQTLQRELEFPSEPPQLDHVEIPPAELDKSDAPAASEAAWLLYFESSLIRLLRDTPLRGSSFSRTPNNIDAVRRVLPRVGFSPRLLKPSTVQKPTSHPTPVHPTSATPRRSYDPGHVSDRPATSSQSQTKVPKARHSFSFGDMMSTPTPSTWKVRRNTSVKKSVLNEGVSGRRVVSAPQKTLQTAKPHSQKLNPTAEDSTEQVPGSLASSQSQNKRQPLRISSSPLPPLQRISAFEIDLPDVATPESPTQDGPVEQSADPPSPGSPSDMLGHGSLRIKPHRTSRIPSDRASTVFSSDNEHSRVFSTDGEDFDCRSETVYDSIRTDATSSSHSGAKGLYADSVFQRPSSSEFPLRSMQVLQDKLAQVTLAGTTLPEHAVDDEVSSRTPTAAGSTAKVLTNPSQLASPAGQATTSSVVPSSTHGRQSSTVAAPNDDFWSIEEEDSNWDDPEAPSSRDGLYLPKDSEQSLVRSASQESETETSTDAASLQRSSLQQYVERGGRTTGRRTAAGMHLRSQSVPLQPESPNYRFNSASKLDAWMLGGKGVSEDWDGDFEFDEPEQLADRAGSRLGDSGKDLDKSGVLVPPAILERQASVHGQFGQVKELSQLVEELRDLHHKAHQLGILHGQSAELWREAEGIVDLATLDEDDVPHFAPHSPNSSSFDFEGFEEDASISNRTVREATPGQDDASVPQNSQATTDASSSLQQPGTPTRPRQESIAKAKHVLEHINQQRSSQKPLPLATPSSPRKLPFDTTSLRDLVTRAGAVKRALAEIVRRVEDPSSSTPTSDKRAQTPPDPPFSQIFQNSPSPSSSRKSPRVHRRKSSSSFLKDSPSPTGSDRNGHMQIMSVV